VADPLTILVAARDEEGRIGATVRALRELGEVIVADDGSLDGTADEAEAAGATVLRLARRGKGQALSAAERAAPPGRLLLVDADLRGDPSPLLESPADLAVAAFARRQGGGFGIAKRTGGALIRLLAGYEAREPLSGQRALSARARAVVFPLAPGFGCEVRMTIDAVRAGLALEEPELDLEHRATGRDAAGFAHRARQLVDALLACAPLRLNYRGDRVPLVGAAFALLEAPTALIGLADDLWSGEQRGFREHLAAGKTTGMLKLVGIPAVAFARTRSVSAALLVGLAANALNQLDTKSGRALKAFVLGSAALGFRPRGALALAVLIAPYDLAEMAMLGDAGSNALGALLGYGSVGRVRGAARWTLIGGLATLTAIGERRSLGELIERSPLFSRADAWGRPQA
jgi:Glycosyl transferase family 2